MHPRRDPPAISLAIQPQFPGQRSRAIFCPETTITPVLQATRWAVTGSVERRGGGPAGRAPRILTARGLPPRYRRFSAGSIWASPPRSSPDRRPPGTPDAYRPIRHRGDRRRRSLSMEERIDRAHERHCRLGVSCRRQGVRPQPRPPRHPRRAGQPRRGLSIGGGAPSRPSPCWSRSPPTGASSPARHSRHPCRCAT